jgi:hypothetical protein
MDIRAVQNQLSVSSTQEIAESGRGERHASQRVTLTEIVNPLADIQTEPRLNALENHHTTSSHSFRQRQNATGERLSIFVEGNLDVCQISTHAHLLNSPQHLQNGTSQTPQIPQLSLDLDPGNPSAGPLRVRKHYPRQSHQLHRERLLQSSTPSPLSPSPASVAKDRRSLTGPQGYESWVFICRVQDSSERWSTF